MKLPYFDEIRTIERISNYCSLYLFVFAMLVVLHNIYMQKNIAYHEINAIATSYTFMKLTANKVYMLTTLKYNVNDIYFLSQLRRTIDFGLK